MFESGESGLFVGYWGEWVGWVLEGSVLCCFAVSTRAVGVWEEVWEGCEGFGGSEVGGSGEWGEVK